jgi:tripartite-type tricarboxylate transporter receptor subunit TctC
MFRLEAGLSFTQVQYPQQQQRIPDLLSGQTHFAFYNTPAVVDLVATGKLRALALAGPKRIAALKDVPTVVEAGFPHLVAEDWVGFVVKAGAPDDAIRHLKGAVNQAIARPKVRDAFARLGYDAAGGSPAELGQLIASQVAYWGRIVKDADIKMPQ